WEPVSQTKFAVNGNKLELEIKRSVLNLTGKEIDIEFKWNDNMQENGNIMDFYVNGDAAPGGRFNFIYTTGNSSDDNREIAFNRQWAEDAFAARSVGSPSDRLKPPVPFSFVYGGRNSSEFLNGWKSQVKDEKVDATRRRRTLTLNDPETGLEVRAVATIYTNTAGVDWTLYFTNKGSNETPVIEQVKAVDVAVVLGEGQDPPVLHRIKGGGGAVDDWMPFDETIAIGQKKEFAPTAGRSSFGNTPWFNLQWDGGGVITAIGWTGQWKASVENSSGTGRIQAGMQNLHTKLLPGETIRSPRIMQLYWFGNDELRAYNLFRHTMLAHVVPRIDGKPVTPPIAHLSTAFYEMDKGTEADILSYLSAIKGLGFEYFWVDAYYGKDDFPTVGNYVFPLLRGFNLKRYPNGMKPIGEAVRKAGMKFLMWFEYERICPGTLIAAEHPEWVVMPESGGWGMFNLAVPEAREYINSYLSQSIKEYGISWLRVDNAVFYEGLWAQLDRDHPDRVGISEIRYVEGHYRLWDDLLKEFPYLTIDNCASGGHRVDLETCSRSIPLWRTDATIGPLLNKDFNQAALQNQVMTAGLSRYVPFSASGQMGATPYLFRSGFNGGISFCEDVRPGEYPRDLLKSAIMEGKRIRKYYSGNFYPLTNVTLDPAAWCVTQYHRTKENDGMIMAFRRPQSQLNEFALTGLREIDPTAQYKVTRYQSYEPLPTKTMTGGELVRSNAEINDSPGSVIIEYEKVSR
ncbi:MAG: alpha-galactosidase, partial [Bacteroidia bacterium]|nr:alpha-galactosidase [Bacteroidia bacterium]